MKGKEQAGIFLNGIDFDSAEIEIEDRDKNVKSKTSYGFDEEACRNVLKELTEDNYINGPIQHKDNLKVQIYVFKSTVNGMPAYIKFFKDGDKITVISFHIDEKPNIKPNMLKNHYYYNKCHYVDKLPQGMLTFIIHDNILFRGKYYSCIYECAKPSMEAKEFYITREEDRKHSLQIRNAYENEHPGMATHEEIKSLVDLYGEKFFLRLFGLSDSDIYIKLIYGSVGFIPTLEDARLMKKIQNPTKALNVLVQYKKCLGDMFDEAIRITKNLLNQEKHE